jgi:hypothetical protein
VRLLPPFVPFPLSHQTNLHRVAPSSHSSPLLAGLLYSSCNTPPLRRGLRPLNPMNPLPEKAVSVDVAWVGLNAGLKKSVCKALFAYSGDGVGKFFEGAVRAAYARKLDLEARSQLEKAGKRKLDDGDATGTQPDLKKAKLHEATVTPQAKTMDLASPRFPFRRPSFRQEPIKFGEPRLSSGIGDTSTAATPRSIFSPSIRRLNAASVSTSLSRKLPRTSSASNPTLLSSAPSLFGNAEAKTPVQQEPEYENELTFADRQPAQPQPPQPPSSSTQYTDFGQPASVSSNTSSQGTNGPPPASTVWKPPFAGVDMSSLKIPANSNVNVTLNVFKAPSSLHQTTRRSAPRRLKCIQCGSFYMEDQNTALRCRRHTGTVTRLKHSFSLGKMGTRRHAGRSLNISQAAI